MILDAVANVGPVSICYDVTAEFRFYKKGVYSRYVFVSMHYLFDNLIVCSKRCKDGSQNVNHAGKFDVMIRISRMSSH